jgi:uncharacterized LabA/DUF88 family protein
MNEHLIAEPSGLAPPPGRRYAIFVDVGYLYASAGELVMGTPRRKEFRVNGPELVHALIERAADRMSGELLRLYWFDAARDRVPSVDQRQIAGLPHVKVRLGNVNRAGQQKGVDALIRGDLEALAAHQAINDAILIGGDEDMIPAVEAAQMRGVRLHLWGVEPPYGSNQSERLMWEADSVQQLDAEFCRPFFIKVQEHPTYVQEAAAAGAAAVSGSTSIAAVGGTGPPGTLASTGPAATDHAAADDQRMRDAGDGQPAAIIATDAQGHPAHGAAPGGAHPPTPSDLFRSLRPELSRSAQAAGGRLGPARERMEAIGEHIAQTWLLTRGKENLADLLPGPLLPQVIDHELLVAAESELGHSLRPYEEARRSLREGFWARLYREFGISVGSSAP